MHLLIDADYMVYAAGFAGQHTKYASIDGGENGTSASVCFYDSKPRDVDGPLWEHTELEPIENVLHSVKKMIQQIMERTEQRFGTLTDVTVYLTGSGNYRERLATIRPYKGNRDPRHKPIYMGDIRQYLVRQWSALVVHFVEADDAVSIAQTLLGDNCVVASIDKDLLQVPGWHYVPKKGFKYITPEKGLMHLYKQIICGDPTDNIAGCYKIGTKKAVDIVKKAAAKGLSLPDLEKELYARALEAYENSIKQYGAELCGYEDAEAALTETAHLVYMLRGIPSNLAEPMQWRAPV
jgi:hypothetical protein